MGDRRRVDEPRTATTRPREAEAPAPALPRSGSPITAASLLAFQRMAGNAAAGALLQRAPLTYAEKEKNLRSVRFAGEDQLEDAYDESPELAKPMKGPGVGKVQSALVDKGYEMPKSLKGGKPDAWYYDETQATGSQFQSDEGLTPTGTINRETMGHLDELAGAGTPAAAARTPEIDATEEAMGKEVAAQMAAVNDPSTFTATSGVWYQYNYFAEHQKDPATFPWNEDWRTGKAPDQYWDKLGYMSWRLKAGVSAAEGVKAWLSGLTIAECLTTIITIEINTLRKAIGDDEFDNRYGSASKPVREKDRLHIYQGQRTTPLEDRIVWLDPEGKAGEEQAGTFGNRPVKEGDWVYFYNHPKYLLKHPGGAWQGENAVYMGRNAAGRQLWSGLGAAGKTEEAMLLEMVGAYNNERDGDDYASLLHSYARDTPEVRSPSDQFKARDVDYLRGLYLKYKSRVPKIYHEDGGEFEDQVDKDKILDDPEYELHGTKRKGGFRTLGHKRLDAGAVQSMRS
jgi:hypothetical protein